MVERKRKKLEWKGIASLSLERVGGEKEIMGRESKRLLNEATKSPLTQFACRRVLVHE